MADRKDDLGAGRWFRQRLTQLGIEYPGLKEPEGQERLTEALHWQLEEGARCPENQRDNLGADQKEVGN